MTSSSAPAASRWAPTTSFAMSGASSASARSSGVSRCARKATCIRRARVDARLRTTRESGLESRLLRAVRAPGAARVAGRIEVRPEWRTGSLSSAVVRNARRDHLIRVRLRHRAVVALAPLLGQESHQIAITAQAEALPGFPAELESSRPARRSPTCRCRLFGATSRPSTEEKPRMAVDFENSFSTAKPIDESYAAILDLDGSCLRRGRQRAGADRSGLRPGGDQGQDGSDVDDVHRRRGGRRAGPAAHRVVLAIKSTEAGGQGYANATVEFAPQRRRRHDPYPRPDHGQGPHRWARESRAPGVLDALIKDFTTKLAELRQRRGGSASD